MQQARGANACSGVCRAGGQSCAGLCLLRGDAAKVQLHGVLVLESVQAAALLRCSYGSILRGMALWHQQPTPSACHVSLGKESGVRQLMHVQLAVADVGYLALLKQPDSCSQVAPTTRLHISVAKPYVRSVTAPAAAGRPASPHELKQSPRQTA